MKHHFIRVALFKMIKAENRTLREWKNGFIKEWVDAEAHYVAGLENHKTSVIKRETIEGESVLYLAKLKPPNDKEHFRVGLYVQKFDCFIGSSRWLILYEGKTEKEAMEIYNKAKERILNMLYWIMYHTAFWRPLFFWKMKI